MPHREHCRHRQHESDNEFDSDQSCSDRSESRSSHHSHHDREPSPCPESKVQSNSQVSVFQSTGTAQIIPTGVDTRVNFNTTEFDSNFDFNVGTGTFQPKVAGFYNITAHVNLQINNTASEIIMYVLKNGIQRIAQTYSFDIPPVIVNGTFFIVTSELSKLVYMNGTTDYLEVFISQSTGPSLTLVSGLENQYFTASLAQRN